RLWAKTAPGNHLDFLGSKAKRHGFKSVAFCHLSAVFYNGIHLIACYSAGVAFSSKNSRTTSISRVRLNGGRLCHIRRPYGLSTRRVSQIISTPRSVSARIRRPAPCLRV